MKENFSENRRSGTCQTLPSHSGFSEPCKPLSRSQLKHQQKQQHKPRQYQPVVLTEIETEVLVFDAELLVAMLLGRTRR